jgi:hypothetical protein
MNNLVVKIIELEENNKVLSDNLDKLKREFIITSESFVADWFITMTRKIITTNPEKVKSIGVERLREIKKEVQELSKQSKELVEEYLNSEYVWKGESFDYRHCNNRLPEKIDKAFKNMLGNLASILKVDGFVKVKVKVKEPNMYYPDSIRDYWSDSYGKLKYPNWIDYTEDLLKMIKDYGDCLEKLEKSNHSLEKLKREKEELSIEDIWDSL